MNANETATTNPLFPTEKLDIVDTMVSLSYLPADEELVGPAPTKAFVESVREFGLLQPVVLSNVGGVLRVIAGRRRIKAARIVDMGLVPARVIKNPAAVNVDVLAEIENAQRSENLAADLDGIEQMLKMGYSEEQIAQAIGVTKLTLRSRMRLLALRPALRHGFAIGKVSADVAAKASRLGPEKQAELEQILEEKGKVTGTDVKEITSAASLQAVAALPDFLFRTPSAEEAGGVSDWRTEVTALLEAALQTMPLREGPITGPTRGHIRAALELLMGGDQVEEAAA